MASILFEKVAKHTITMGGGSETLSSYLFFNDKIVNLIGGFKNIIFLRRVQSGQRINSLF